MNADSLFRTTDSLQTGWIVSGSPAVSTYQEIPGIEGTPVAYRLRSDNGITALLLLCFFISAYVLSKGKKFFLQQIKDFTYTRERASIFTNTTAVDFRYRLLLLFQTCVLLSVCFFDYFQENQPELTARYPSYLLLGIYITVCIAGLFFKWQLYRLLGWVFFDKSKTSIWLESYSVILYYLGFSLFPLLLLAVYFDLPTYILLPCILSLIIIAKILMFYKWIKLFFIPTYGIFYLIVYFCTLELIPLLVLYQELVQINNLLLIKL